MKIETPILRRLGPVPFWRGTVKCLDELERMYRRARVHAQELLPEDEAGETGVTSETPEQSEV